ncbi:MAG: cytidine deaminase [Candidatus Wallbacteria bacterium]|nr:cytidine deaminase [Candidatus Wallbacteria bacterium]
MLERLIEEARKAQARAYNPYSRFSVGAALETKNGKIYSGCNVENASYSLTNCAERTAIFKAVSEGEREFLRMVITSSSSGFTPPCGACRQVMSEFGDFSVILVDGQGQMKQYQVSDLLPCGFTL